MAILNNSNAISSGGYDINNSLRFRSSASAYLSRTPSSATNRTTWTWSSWVKRGALSGGTQFGRIMSTQGSFGVGINFMSDDTLRLYFGGSSTLQTTQVFRDPSAWYHVVVALDTTQATAANRVKLYINGTQVTAFSSATYPSLNDTFGWNNSSIVHQIGASTGDGATAYFDGYQADINAVDGQALTPSSFGETDTTTGVWKPKAYTSTYGTNGFYLKFSDIATTSGSNAGLGKDFSGNANYWTTNNISVTAGTTYDAMIDSPTLTSATVANYCVLNPLLGDALDLPKDGNLKVGGTANNYSVGTIAFPTTGKFYAEATVTTYSSGQVQIGICPANATSTLGSDATAYFQDGTTTKNNVASTTLASYTQGDVIGIAVDVDNSTVQFYKNNTAQTALTSVLRISTASFFTYMSIASSVVNFNFGQRPFSYTPPTGFVRLNTYNLPDSTIKKGNTVMDATLYTGNGTTTGDSQVVTNAGGFKPDLVWIKSRSAATWNVLTDSVRGTNKTLYSNDTFTEESLTNVMNSFNSNGFTPAYNSTYTSVKTNNNGATYVGWQWQAGQGSTSSNTSGTITSTTSVNATAGFSIVTYTGTGANATVGHGLGVAPKFYMVKTRSTTSNWAGYHVGIASAPTQAIYLNLTNAANVDTSMWNSTAPTSSVFSLGTSGTINTSSSTYVAYCWADVSGFSKAFSYTGNGNADGPMVYLGFRPKFIIIKRTDSTSNWVMFDTSRSTYNLQQADLYANLSDAEATNAIIPDILSNGFKVRTSNATWNTNGGTWIGMAFAENPFKNSLAR